MAAEVGSAYFTLLPSVKGLQGAIGKEVAGVNGDAAGATIGRKLGGGIAGGVKALVGPAIALAAGAGIANFLGDAIEGVKGWQVLQAQTDAVIKSTGGSANVSAAHIDQLVQKTEALTATQGETIQQGANMLLTFTNIRNEAGKGNDVFDQATKAMVDYSRATGTDAKSAAVQLGKALNDPVKGITALGKAGVQFTADQKEQIKTMVEAGDTLGAQKVILKELNTQFGGSGASYAQTTAGKLYLLSDAYGDLGEGIVKGFMPAVGAGAGLMTQFLGKITPFAEAASAKAGQFVVNLVNQGPKIGAAMGGISALITKGDFTGALTDAFGIQEDSPIVGGILKLREIVTTTLQGIKDFVLGFTIPFEFLDAAGVDTSGLVGIGVMVRDVFDSLWAAAQPLIPQFVQLWQSLSPLSLVFQSLGPVLPQIVGAIGQLATAVGAGLAGALSAAMPALMQLSEVLVNALGTVFAAVAPVIVSLLGQMGGLFTQLGPVIGMLVAVVAGLISQLVSSLMPIFLELVTAVMPMVVQIFFAVAQAVIPFVTMVAGLLIPIIQALLPVVTVVFQTVANVIRSVMQIVMGIIQVVTGIISGNWQQVWNGILNILSGVWNLIVGVIQGALGIVGGIITAGIGLATGFIRSAFNGVVSFLGGVWRNITDGVSGMIGNVTGFFSGLIGKITGAIGNAGGALLQTGKDIVQGLIDGIGSMMGAIGRAVINIIPEAIRGPFEKLLGIQSPSRVAMWWGEMIGDGLVGGIVAQYDKVAEAVGGLVVAPPTTSLAMAGGRYAYDVRGAPGGHGGPLVEQHVHPSEKMSEVNLATIAAREVVGALT